MSICRPHILKLLPPTLKFQLADFFAPNLYPATIFDSRNILQDESSLAFVGVLLKSPVADFPAELALSKTASAFFDSGISLKELDTRRIEAIFFLEDSGNMKKGLILFDVQGLDKWFEGFPFILG